MNVEEKDGLWNQGHAALKAANEELASTLFTQLADVGDWRGSYMLGWILEKKGGRTQKNVIAAAHWYTRALSQGGQCPVHFALARYYYYGLGGYCDYKLAFEHLQKSCAEQEQIVQMMKAELLYQGLGVAKDTKAARMLFNSAAEAGYPAALIGLALLAKSEKKYVETALYFFRAILMAVKLVIEDKNHPRLIGIGGKRGTLSRKHA